LPQYKFDGWFGLGAPAGVPRDILERLNAALNEALKDSAVRVRFEAIGAVPIGLELDKAKTFLVDEVVKYRDIITKAGIAKIE
jgi:tripartite-type tricarboxylate transporter receptor subunit TctC